MTGHEARWSISNAAAILLPYTIRGTLLSFLYLILPAILRAGGTSLTMTTLSALVFVPVGLAWLWAPLMDRGRWRGRRGWVIGALLLASAAFVGLARLDPLDDYMAVLGIALLVAGAGATVGTATDAAIMDGVAPRHRSWANALQAAGVALGGLTVGGIGILYGAHGWAATGIFMAALMAVSIMAIILAPGIREDTSPAVEEPSPPAASLLRDPRARQTLLVVILSRAGLHLPMGILAAFQIDAGLSVSTAALIGGVGGAVAGLVGAAIGGAIATHLAPRPAIVTTLGASAGAAAALAIAAVFWGPTPSLAVALAAYVFLLTTPVFVAMHRQFMFVARPGRHASDMSLLTGTEFLFGLIIAASAGWIVEAGGYSSLFALAALSAVAGMLVASRHLGREA